MLNVIYAECHNHFVLGVIMLRVVMLNVIMLSIMAQFIFFKVFWSHRYLHIHIEIGNIYSQYIAFASSFVIGFTSAESQKIERFK